MIYTVTEHNGEHLRRIKNHPRYFVSDAGYVYSHCTDELKQLQPEVLPNGHTRVMLDGNKEYIANLVMEAFNPKSIPNTFIFHVDDDKMNNDLNNLVWLTRPQIHMFSQYSVDYRKQMLGKW